ncbi:TRAP transporter small permease [Sneathiella aquimaris]|uniref:TRAP transporter small permease n=1 Tax=Sneathiella aquimaris TaxID=2599305 RepID=UPI00146F1E2D|nr:TRAP transporter small permease subunit [Sneathiella aquimaris]
MRAIAVTLDQISSQLNRIALWGAVAAVLVMVMAASWQVFARYLLDAPPVWTEELSRRAMVWAGMLGASAAFRYRADPTLFPAMVAIRGPLGTMLAVIRAVGVLLFTLPVIWYSLFGANMNITFGFLGRSLARQAELLPVSMIWFTAAVPIAFVLILIHMIASLSIRFTGLEQAEDLKNKE